MKFSTSSDKKALIANSKGSHIINPWFIEIDTIDEIITVKKRNSYLIGIDEQIISFKHIRSIEIDQHFIGADIHITVSGNKISAYCLSKSDAKEIRKILVDFNRDNNNSFVLV